jgi:hypothetical protein
LSASISTTIIAVFVILLSGTIVLVPVLIRGAIATPITIVVCHIKRF